ncbi:hypothetical protein PMNALOAF_4108 [Methylobacterium adhaesivum]|uniref:Recombinase domain-containing protein n=1 Tax=Methylobacterium adhaesivum TaxID=333297 RepID=A0ABT8BJY9_9HYPH|nr:hypothetical protein [Methylobacterium adhaesivum]MDN3592487.1 hypothetical protein [Methylobacterium adhaesivum]GJD32829.1 hypothetical protein PMNALOAF_4108 [Methylobacterium adhaesivum]
MPHHLIALAPSAGRASARVRSARTVRRAVDLAPVIHELRAAGATSLRTLAARLTEAGIAAPRAAAWSHVAVARVLDQIERGAKKR